MSSTEDMGGLAPEKDPLVADEPEKAIMVEKSEIGRKEVFVALSNGSMEEWLRFERKG